MRKPQNERDWVGNKKSTFVTLGASNHAERPRQEHDYYATDHEQSMPSLAQASSRA